MEQQIAFDRLVRRIAVKLNVTLAHARAMAEIHYGARPAR